MTGHFGGSGVSSYDRLVEFDVAEFVRILTRFPAIEMFRDLPSRSAIGGTLTRFRYKFRRAVALRSAGLFGGAHRAELLGVLE